MGDIQDYALPYPFGLSQVFVEIKPISITNEQSNTLAQKLGIEIEKRDIEGIVPESSVVPARTMKL